MKVEVVQTLCPAATGNYDITGTTPSGDMVGAIFENSATTTNNTNVASMRWGFGATDLTSNIGLSMGAQDATIGAGIRSMLSNTNCLFTANGVGAQTAPVAAYASTLSAGVRLTTSAVTANRLTNALLVSGTDTSMKVGSVFIGAGASSSVVTHGLGGTPDCIILLASFGVTTNEADGTGVSIGFWDRTSTNQSSVAFRATTGANPTDIASYASNTTAGSILTAAALGQSVTITSVGSTQFTIQLSASGTANGFGWVALRGTRQMYTKNILMQTPTSTGASTIISGMSGRPQAFIAIPTRLTVANTIKTDDSAGSMGYSFAATNDYTTTTQGCNATTFQDGVATSNAATMMSNTLANLSLDNTGAADIQATLSSWNTDGVTLNYSNAGASLFEQAVLAFGAQTSQPAYIPRRIFRPVSTIYYPR